MAAEGAPMQTYSPAYGQDPESSGAGQSTHSGQPMEAMGQPSGGQPYGDQLGGDPYGGDQPSGEDLLLQAKEQERQEMEAQTLGKKQAGLEAGRFAVQTVVCLALLNIVLLAVPLFGTSWNSKAMVGFGVKSLSIRTDIFVMDIGVACGKHDTIEEFVCKRFDHIRGTHTLHTALSRACALNDMACNIMSYIYWGSVLLFCSFFLGICFMLVGIVFTLFYWYSAPRPKVRHIANASFILSLLTIAAGLGIWTCIVPDLGEIPRAWTHGLGLLGGDSGVFGLEETNGFQYGWCWAMAVVALMSVGIQTVLWQYLFVPHPGEEGADKREAERRQELADREPLMLAENPPQAYGAQGYSRQDGQYFQEP